MRELTLNRLFWVPFLSLGLILGPANADIKEGLVAHWKFDEGSGDTASDSTGNGNDGTLIDGPQWTTGYIGDAALHFDGTDDYVAIQNFHYDNDSGLEGVTVALWIRTTNEANQIIATFDRNEYWRLEINGSGAGPGQVGWDVWAGTAQVDYGSVTRVDDGEWHHVAGVFDAGTLTIYIDGNPEPTASGDSTFGRGRAVRYGFLGVGSEATSFNGAHTPADYFDGDMDEVRIYNRALTAEEIVEVRDWAEAYAGSDFRVYGGDTVALTGSGPADLTSATWQQVAGTPQVTLQATGDMVAEFDAPELEIGTILTFRLSVDAPSTDGITTDHVNVTVIAINPPKVAPSNFRISPLDLGVSGLGFRLEWPPLLDAEQYQIARKMQGTYYWTDTIATTWYEVKGLVEGETRKVAVRGENKYSKLLSTDPADHGAQSEDVTYTAKPNLTPPAALGGTRPPLDPVQGVTYKVSHYSIAGMNDNNYDDTNDSWNALYKEQDFWGYQWPEPLFFDHIVYFTGNMFGNGGWFTDLKVQNTEDGTEWKEIPILDIIPDYDFTDQRNGKQPFTRYDIVIPTVRGTGIRIYGIPGGTATFTSIAELEVFGNQKQGPLVVQAIDAEYPEGRTATLDGSYSFSTGGPIVSGVWEQLSGPTVIIVLDPGDPLIARFDAPIVDKDTLFVFKLTAGDGTDTLSDEDVRILVNNVKTTAVAGPDQPVEEGSEVTLDGSGSLTTSGNITYLWNEIGGTDLGVDGATTPTVTFTAPIIWGYTEELTFELQVDDRLAAQDSISTDQVVVVVANAAAWPAYPLDQAPTTYYMQNLLHLGRIPTDRITDPLNIRSGADPLDAFGGRPYIKPYPGVEYDFTGTGVTVTANPMVWTPIHSDDGWFGNEDLNDFQQIYHIYILSPEDRDVRWHYRHDDEIRLWNNGVLVFSIDDWDHDNERVQLGRAADGTGLSKGLNSITMTFEEGGGGNHIAVGITDPSNKPFDDLLYSFGPSLLLTDVHASRMMPTSYQPGGTLHVDLQVKVKPDIIPPDVTIAEWIPMGLTEADVNAPGAMVGGGIIAWILAGGDVKPGPLSYSLMIPQEMTRALNFQGTVSFESTTVDIYGENTMYPVPSAPTSLTLEMLAAAHLSWSASPEDGIRVYTIYRSVDGGAWQAIAITRGTSYLDKSVESGKGYSYQVSATNLQSTEGPTCRPSEQTSVPDMEIREAEDFDYGRGLYPGSQDCPAANEAPAESDLDAQYDFYHPHDGGPNTYRPANVTPGGIGIETIEEADDPGVDHTNIGWINAGSWWRYTFNVTEAGWIKLSFRLAGPTAQLAVAAYWDGEFIGIATAPGTGNFHIFTWAALEDQIETTTGEHTLRVQAVDTDPTQQHDINFDKIAIGWNWSPPPRKTIWGDDFDSYTANSEVFDPQIGGWTKQTAGYPDGAWQLWNTAGDPMNGEDPDIAAMEDGYIISNSDMSGEGALLDEQLISPQIDTDGYTKLRLSFNKNYRIYALDPDRQQIAEVDIRLFDAATGWGDWINLLHLDTSSVPPGQDPAIDSSSEVFDLSAYDGKKLQFRWHFYDADWDFWFAVDKIRVSGVKPKAPIPLPVLTKDGNTLTLSWDAFGTGQYAIEYTTDLLIGIWTQMETISDTSWSVTLPADPAGYYRIAGSE